MNGNKLYLISQGNIPDLDLNFMHLTRALASVICDVIKIRLKRSIATRSGKGNQPINIKTAVERPILKLGLPNFRWSF